MKKSFNMQIDETLKETQTIFNKKMNSKTNFDSKFIGDVISFDWLDEVEFDCPYIDNIVRNPRPTLISDNYVEKIEKAKKIGVESIKDLSKHTNFIEKVDKVTQDVQPSRILMLNREETFNTYENRIIYTLIVDLDRFIMKKEDLLKDFEIKNEKSLDYKSNTNNGYEKITIELKISAKEMDKGKKENNINDELEEIKKRVKRVRDYLSSWKRSAFFTSLEKEHVPFVLPPIRKTNMVLKNPNFQVAMKLWDFLRNFVDDDNKEKNSLNKKNDKLIKSILDSTFVTDYYALDLSSLRGKKQKEKIIKYAILMLVNQVNNSVDLLLKNGINVTDEEILKILSIEIKREKNQISIGSNDVKNKFRKAMDEYLEKTKEYL